MQIAMIKLSSKLVKSMPINLKITLTFLSLKMSLS